jgi:hypothetical protein
MTTDAHEFIRRFLLHVLPDGFQRIRHYGFLANGHRKTKLAIIRKLLNVAPPEPAATDTPDEPTAATPDTTPPCPCCGGRMRIIEVLADPRRRRLRFDSS